MGRRLSGSFAAFRDVFRNPNLRRLQLAWVGSVAGQYSFSIAIAIYAYRHGGAASVGVMALIRTIPSAVLAPLLSAAGDRYRQERVMLAADILRAAFVGVIAALVFAGGSPAIVFVLAAFGPIISTAFHPAQAALLPLLARTPEELTASNVSSSTIESVAAFAGPAIGGIILATWGIGAALIFTLVTYLWSASLIVRVRPERGAPTETTAAEEGGGSFRGEALAGFRAVLAEPALRLIVGLYGAQTVVAGAMGVLVVVAALRLFNLGSGGVGWLYSACGVGGVIGAAITLALVGRRKLAGDFGIGLLLWGLPFLVMALWPNTVVALIMLGVLGVGNTLVDVSALTLLQRNAPEAVRSRVFGVVESMLAATIGLGAILAPLLSSLVGIRAALFVTGAFLPVVTGLLWRKLIALDAGRPEHLALLQRIPIFALLPPQSLERLARSLQQVEIAAGTVLFGAGDVGDRFYIVESGELAVDLATGTKVEGPGRWVGEIALLRDVPRTATVRAKTDAVLLALDRDEFLGAVTGHAPANAAANEIVGERLALSPV